MSYKSPNRLRLKSKRLECSRSDAPAEYNGTCRNGECDIPSKITNNLYLGSTCARHPDILRSLGIKYIVTCNKEDKPYKKGEFVSFHLLWDDDPDQILFPSIVEAYNFMNAAINRGQKVLVHCYAGISRSASVVIFYLMMKRGWGFQKAYEYVKQRRKIVDPNDGFRNQLKSLKWTNK